MTGTPSGSASRLSQKDIPLDERLIVALDVPSKEGALHHVEELGESVRFYKLGLELAMAGGYFELAEQLVGMGKRVFVDLKLFDVPNTVASAVRQLKDRNVDFVTVHGNDEMLQAAAAEKNGHLKVLAVTVLTSLDQSDLDDLGFQVDIEKLVLSRAKRALEAGCDGVISSGIEVPALREEHGDRFLIVVPGIRPVENIDDQKRTVDVETAFNNGADYIVVGRPILQNAHPKKAAEKIQARIAATFSAPHNGH